MCHKGKEELQITIFISDFVGNKKKEYGPLNFATLGGYYMPHIVLHIAKILPSQLLQKKPASNIGNIY